MYLLNDELRYPNRIFGLNSILILPNFLKGYFGLELQCNCWVRVNFFLGFVVSLILLDWLVLLVCLNHLNLLKMGLECWSCLNSCFWLSLEPPVLCLKSSFYLGFVCYWIKLLHKCHVHLICLLASSIAQDGGPNFKIFQNIANVSFSVFNHSSIDHFQINLFDFIAVLAK